MANITFNIAKGRIVELYNRVKSNDPTNAALIIIPIETSGLESDATLIDADSVSALLAAGRGVRMPTSSRLPCSTFLRPRVVPISR